MLVDISRCSLWLILCFVGSRGGRGDTFDSVERTELFNKNISSDADANKNINLIICFSYF